MDVKRKTARNETLDNIPVITVGFLMILILAMCLKTKKKTKQRESVVTKVAGNGTMGTINWSYQTNNEEQTPKNENIPNKKDCEKKYVKQNLYIADEIDKKTTTTTIVKLADEENPYDDSAICDGKRIKNTRKQQEHFQEGPHTKNSVRCTHSSDTDLYSSMENLNKQRKPVRRSHTTNTKSKKNIYDHMLSRQSSLRVLNRNSLRSSMRRLKSRSKRTKKRSNEKLEAIGFRQLSNENLQYKDINSGAKNRSYTLQDKNYRSLRRHNKWDLNWAEENYLTSRKKSKRKTQKSVPKYMKPVSGLPPSDYHSDISSLSEVESVNSPSDFSKRRKSSSIYRSNKHIKALNMKRKLSLDRKHFVGINKAPKNRLSDVLESPSFFVSFDSLTPPDSPMTSSQEILSANHNAAPGLEPSTPDSSSTSREANEEPAYQTIDQINSPEENKVSESNEKKQVPPIDYVYATVNKAAKKQNKVAKLKQMFEQNEGDTQMIRPKNQYSRTNFEKNEEKEDVVNNNDEVLVVPMSPEERRRRRSKTLPDSPETENVVIGKIVDGYLMPMGREPEYMDIKNSFSVDGETTLVRTARLKHTAKLNRNKMRTYTSNSLRRLDKSGLEYQGELPPNRFVVEKKDEKKK